MTGFYRPFLHIYHRKPTKWFFILISLGICSPAISSSGPQALLTAAVVSLRAAGRFRAWLVCCHVVIRCRFIFQLTKVPLKLNSSVFTNTSLCNIRKLFPSVWAGLKIYSWEISTLHALEKCYPKWVMEFRFCSRKQIDAEWEREEGLSFHPCCVSRHSRRLCQNMFPQPFNPFSRVCNFPGYFCVLHSMIKCWGQC